MALAYRVRPVLALVNCAVCRPEHINPLGDVDVERGVGAVGVGLVHADELLILSLHQPGGEALIAAMDMDEASRVHRLLGLALAEAVTTDSRVQH